MQRFQELSLRSLANMHHHDKRVWRRIKRLEQNIRLVAHAVVLSQIEESKSRVLIKKINQELQALKGAVKNSYIWHVCKMKKKMFSGFNLKITTHQCKVFFFCRLKNVFIDMTGTSEMYSSFVLEKQEKYHLLCIQTLNFDTIDVLNQLQIWFFKECTTTRRFSWKWIQFDH